jgi:hypothetical protein
MARRFGAGPGNHGQAEPPAYHLGDLAEGLFAQEGRGSNRTRSGGVHTDNT